MTGLRQAIALLSLAGLFVALYLWLHRVGLVGALSCGAAGGCDVVQASRYAVLLGQPVALYGVAGYALLLGTSLAGLHPRLAGSRRITLALVLLASGGFAFTLYLKYLELFVIHAVCRWCVASAAIITAIWVVAVVAWRRRFSSPALRTGP